MSETRILIADDHDVVRSGLRTVLEAQPGWIVVAEAGDGRDAVAKALETKPNVAIIDYSLPLLNGAEVTRQIHSRLPSVEVLIFTMHDSDSLLADILSAGARAYLLKSDANQYLIAAVTSLADHKPFFTAKVSEQLLDSYLSAHQVKTDELSPRERVVVQLIAEGHSNRDMSEALGLSLKTIEVPSRFADAETQAEVDGGDRSLCDPQPVRRAMKVGHASRQIQLHRLGCPLMTPNDCPFVTTSRLTNRIEASGRTLSPRSQRCTTRLLKRRAIHAGLIMTPGLIGKPRKSPPVGKPRVPSQGSVVAVSPPGSVVAVPPPGSVIAPPSAAVAMPPTMSDGLCTINTTLINRIDVSLCYGRQSPCWLGQEQASGNTRCARKLNCLGVTISASLSSSPKRDGSIGAVSMRPRGK